MEIDDIKEKAEKEVKIDQDDLLAENVRQVSMHHRYLTLLEEHKRKLRKIERLIDRKYSTLYHFFRHESQRRLKSKAEVENAIEKDIKLDEENKIRKSIIETKKRYQKAKKMRDEQQDIVEYIEGVVELLKSRYFVLKNLVEMDKMEKTGA